MRKLRRADQLAAEEKNGEEIAAAPGEQEEGAPPAEGRGIAGPACSTPQTCRPVPGSDRRHGCSECCVGSGLPVRLDSAHLDAGSVDTGFFVFDMIRGGLRIREKCCSDACWGWLQRNNWHYFDYHENDRIDFDVLFHQSDSNDEQQNLENFGNTPAPNALHRAYLDDPNLDFENHKVASVSASCLLATSWGSMQAVCAILGLPSQFRPVPEMYEFDLRAMQFVSSSMSAAVLG